MFQRDADLRTDRPSDPAAEYPARHQFDVDAIARHEAERSVQPTAALREVVQNRRVKEIAE